MAMLPCVPPISSIHVPWHKQQSLIFWRLRGKINLFPCRMFCEKNRVPPIPWNFIEKRGHFHQLQWTIHWFSPKLSTSPDLGPIEDVSRYYLKKLGAKHRENLRATVESLESTPGSQVSMHLLANASIENCRNEVFRIAKVLVQESQAEVCRIANVWTRTERSSSLGHVKFRQIKEPVVEFLHVLSMVLAGFRQTMVAVEESDLQRACSTPPVT